MKHNNQSSLVPALLLAGCLLTTALHAQNLLVNGDFSAGNSGFTSGYTFSPSGQSAVAGTYGIRSLSQDFNAGYSYFTDHTTGGGNMMLVDGSTSGGVTVWRETVSVAPNGNYVFSGWATAADNANVPTLRFFINGVQAGSDLTLSAASPGVWQQFSVTWGAGANTSATISIVDENQLSFGNDFALDDFSFSPLANVSLGTAFTYQGRLNAGGGLANGIYDFTFSLFATNANGTAIAGPVTNALVGVTNGLFTTTVDFGNSFNGARNWLEIAVSPSGSNTFTTLAPRQPITPTPYALYSASAATAATASTAGSVSGPVSASQVTGTLASANLPLSIYDYRGNLVAGASGASTNITSTSGNNSGGDNVGLGDYALTADTSGYYNTAVGYYSMNQNTSGSQNTGLGAGALQNNTSGAQNTAVGFQALYSTGNATQDTAVGYHALLSTYAGNNTAVGYNALATVTGNSEDTAVGSQAMPVTTGGGNTALGFSALYQNTSGGGNVAIGDRALFSGTTNGGSVAIGENALGYNYASGNYNVAIGNAALAISGGGNNTAVGAYAMDTGNSVNNNTAIGYQALGNSPGDGNVALGYRAGNNLTSGTNNIYIGNPGGSSENNTIRLGDPSVHSATYIAGVINGNGAGLTNIPVTQLSGTVQSAQINGTYANTVNFSSAANNFNGKFSGDGSGLTNLDETQISSNVVQIVGQIQPRMPIGSAPFTITNPGSYYLAANLIVSSGNAIIIAASGVTLDLSGFAISSTSATPSGAGIQINSGLQNITIMNGFIQGGVTNDISGNFGGSGFADGIYYPGGAQPVNVLVSRVSVSGCLNYGIFIGNNDSDLVEDCTVRSVGSYGIFASTVKTCSAINCGYTAIYGDQVSDCRAQSIDSGDGIDGWTVDNSYAAANGGDGVRANNVQTCTGTTVGSGRGILANTIMNSTGASANGDGIHANGNAENCNGSSSGGYGVYGNVVLNSYGIGGTVDAIHANSAQNCYGSSSSGSGVSANLAQGCYGLSGSASGVSANNAQNCYGHSSSGYGVYADNAFTCNGSSDTSWGIYANYTVQSCYGQSSGNNNTDGIYAQNAFNSTGSAKTGDGLNVINAENSSGYSGLNYGIQASSALNSYGYVTNNSGGLTANVVMNCTGGSSLGVGIGANNAENSYGTGAHIGLTTDTALNCSGYGGAGSGIGVVALTAAFSHGGGSTNFSVTHNINSY